MDLIEGRGVEAVEAMNWKAVEAVEVLPTESTAQTRNEKEWLWNQIQARRICWFVAPCNTITFSGFASCAMALTAAEALAFQTKSEKHCHVVILLVSCQLCRLLVGLLLASHWSLICFLPASCCLQPATTGHNRPLIGDSCRVHECLVTVQQEVQFVCCRQ